MQQYMQSLSSRGSNEVITRDSIDMGELGKPEGGTESTGSYKLKLMKRTCGINWGEPERAPH